MHNGLIAVAGPGKKATVWMLHTGEHLLTAECAGNVLGLHLSRHPNSPVLMTGDTTGAACMWQVPTSAAQQTKGTPKPLHTFMAKALIFTLKITSTHDLVIGGDVRTARSALPSRTAAPL